MVNLELYRSFYAVARTGSLTAAAKELFVTQPALSQAVITLERQLGGQLFARTQKGMVLTPEGERIFPFVESALNSFRNAENDFLHMKELAAGSIRIGASDTLCRHFLLPYIRKFRSLYPEVSIHVMNRTTRQTLDLLRAGSVDVAFVNLPIPPGYGEFEEKPLMPLHDIFTANPDTDYHVLSAGEISKMPLIAMENLSNTRSFLDKHMEALGAPINPEIELGSFDLVVEFTKAGFGIGCVTEEFVGKELREGSIKKVRTDFSIPPRAVGGVTRRHASLAFAAEKFMEMIVP